MFDTLSILRGYTSPTQAYIYTCILKLQRESVEKRREKVGFKMSFFTILITKAEITKAAKTCVVKASREREWFFFFHSSIHFLRSKTRSIFITCPVLISSSRAPTLDLNNNKIRRRRRKKKGRRYQAIRGEVVLECNRSLRLHLGQKLGALDFENTYCESYCRRQFSGSLI